MNDKWTEIKVTVRSGDLDVLTGIMSEIDPALSIEDNRGIGPDPVYGELIDDRLLKLDREHCSAALYLEEGRDTSGPCSFIESRLKDAGIRYEMTVTERSSSEWENSWKKYYHTLKIGKVVIRPEWEDYSPEPGETVISMDPGMAFGTGTHETTRLVLEMLQRYMTPGVRMLDIGTGSGILSICASKLGASECRAYDLDPDAVRIAAENCVKNGVSNVKTGVSDLLASADYVPGGYSLVTANIVADIILRMLPGLGRFMAAGAVCILSGIIDRAEPEVLACLKENGFEVRERRTDGDWVCLAVAQRP